MKRRNIVRTLLAGAIGIALIAGLFQLTGVSVARLDALFARLYGPAFLGIVGCTFLYIALGAAKWRVLAAMPSPRPFFYTFYTSQAMLLGQFLPTPVAIAVNRAAVMKLRQNATVKKGFLNALYDMGFDFGVALVLVPVSLLQWMYKFDFMIWLLSSTAILCATTAVLMHMPHLIPSPWLVKFGLAEERKRGMLSKRTIGLMMLLSAARLVVVIARLALGAMAIGAAIPLAVIAYATPPATMPSLLMLTPANLGIAEWSWTYLLSLWGVATATAALYGVSFRMLLFAAQVIVSGACWILFACLPKAQKKAA